MNHAQKFLGAASVALVAFGTTAHADNEQTVQVFYDLLSNPGSESHASAFLAIAADDWQSIGDYSGDSKNRDGFLGQMGGFAQLMPDMNWEVQAIYDSGDFVTVRSRATGTPVAPFFGVDGEGRSFDIMTIDVHEVVDGKIVRTYHVEDWAGALQQLAGR